MASRLWMAALPALLALGCQDPAPDTGDTEDTGTPWPTPDLVVTVDLGTDLGIARSLTGVNRSPIIEARTTTDTFDFSSLWGAFGVHSVRLHDAPVDVCRIYLDDTLTRFEDSSVLDPNVCQNSLGGIDPTALWAVNTPADVDLPANYDFAEADAAVDAVLGAGMEWMMRLGESWNGPNSTLQT
ncbi:MAG: hypothetical protein JRJ84_22580, partial [Deltaproteobacteria bacterium]|nr:hypothetical protein [Deltaproteobacteria bacterium]